MCALNDFTHYYSGKSTGFEKKTNGIAKDPEINETNIQNWILALRFFAT